MPELKMCPRCQNEEIYPCDKFCKICGLNLQEIRDAVQVLIDKGITPEQYALSYYKTVVKS